MKENLPTYDAILKIKQTNQYRQNEFQMKFFNLTGWAIGYDWSTVIGQICDPGTISTNHRAGGKPSSFWAFLAFWIICGIRISKEF